MSIYSISEKGRRFLGDYLVRPKPLMLKMTAEMVTDDDETTSTDEDQISNGYILSNVSSYAWMKMDELPLYILRKMTNL